MKTNIPILAVTLALTVFLTSLVLETRDSASHRARVSRVEIDAMPAGGQLGLARDGFGDGALGRPSDQPAGSRVDELLSEAKRFHDAGNIAGAMELLQAVLALDEDNVQALGAAGRTLFSQRQYAEAEPYLRRELQLAADTDCLLRMRLGVVQMRQHKYGPALENLKIVLQSEPDDGAVHFAIACIYADLEEESRALYHIERAKSQLGATLLAHISDPHLDNLRHLPRFQRIVSAVRQQHEYAPGASATPQVPFPR